MIDIHIVGGGIIGCSIAWRLSQSGAHVTLSEAGRLGREASWAGAGILSPGGASPEWARRSIASLAQYPAFVAELSRESGIEVDYRVTGALELAYTDHEMAEIHEKAGKQAAIGIRSSVIAPEDARLLVPGLNVDGLRGAVHYPDEAIVDPRGMLAALEAALRARGVDIREHSPVTTLPPADVVVLAAGAWSSAIVAGIPESFPVKGVLVGYELPPASVPVILKHGHSYVMQRAGGYTIAGSTADRVGFDRSLTPSMVQRLHQRVHRYLPHLLVASPDESWIGFRPGIEGDDPQVRPREGSNLRLAYGHYKKGILLAPETAEMIARM